MILGITGGTGLIGQHIARIAREQGHEVVIFSRHPKQDSGNSQKEWNPATKGVDAEAFARLDAIVHLAGAGVADKRWTSARKAEIRSSRIEGTRFLVECLNAHASRCRALISASAIGWYGPDRPGAIPFTEEALPADDFLAQTCAAWEAEAFRAAPRLRVATVRVGIVLGREGGAYPQFAWPLRFGAMPVLGSGKQIISWIHVDDVARLFLYAATHEHMTGPYNGVAPSPVSNRALMHTLGEVKGGLRIPLPVPAIALRIGLGEMSVEVFKSCTVSAGKTLASGFSFRYPQLRGALEELQRKNTQSASPAYSAK